MAKVYVCDKCGKAMNHIYVVEISIYTRGRFKCDFKPQAFNFCEACKGALLEYAKEEE